MSSPLTFDLVMATVERTSEPARFLEALAEQSYSHFRVLIVDQNLDDRLLPVIEMISGCMEVQRLPSPVGLSRARNVALRHMRGDVVAFVDDDSWYPADLLERTAGLLAANPGWDGISGRVIDQAGKSSSARWDVEPGPVDKSNVWSRGASAALFLRRRLVEGVGAFDESLGLGSGTPYGSGEETDYLVRAVELGFVMRYEPSLTVIHPDNRREFNAATIRAGYSYGAGMGRVLRLHYSWWHAIYHVFRAIGGGLLAMAAGRRGEARFLWAVARGRLRGWLG